MAASAEFIQAIPYFSHLSTEGLAAVCALTFEKSYPKDEVILLEGEPAEAIYFVASGSVRIVKTSIEGKEQVLRIMRPGDSFNDVPVFDGGPNPATAIAQEPTRLYGIPKGAMKKILQDYPQVAENIIRVFASRLRHMVSLVEDLSFRHVMGRVAKLLLEQAEEGEFRLSQQEIAALVGTAREVVGRSLKSLEAMGAIQVERRRIILLRPEILQQLV